MQDMEGLFRKRVADMPPLVFSSNISPAGKEEYIFRELLFRFKIYSSVMLSFINRATNKNIYNGIIGACFQ